MCAISSLTSSRSLSHLLMSSCKLCQRDMSKYYNLIGINVWSNLSEKNEKSNNSSRPRLNE